MHMYFFIVIILRHLQAFNYLYNTSSIHKFVFHTCFTGWIGNAFSLPFLQGQAQWSQGFLGISK